MALLMGSRVTLAIIAGLAALLALASTAAAAPADRNGDGIPDRWERAHRLSLQVKQSRRDQDRDGLSNRDEYDNRTDPRDSDTDEDSIDDGDELDWGFDPADPDTDEDGIDDGDENAGEVRRYNPDSGRLVIDLAAGGRLRGRVTEDTEVLCDSVDGDEDPGDGENADDDYSDLSLGQRPGPAPPAGTAPPTAVDEPGTGSAPNEGDDPGDGQEPDNEGGDDPGLCPMEDVERGTIVYEAEVRSAGRRAIFELIDLDI